MDSPWLCSIPLRVCVLLLMRGEEAQSAHLERLRR